MLVPQSGVCFPGHFPMFVLCTCSSACCQLTLVGLCNWGGGGVFCCPPVCGSLLFVVVFVFLGGSAELFCTHARRTFYVNFSSSQQVFARPLSQCISQGFVFPCLLLGLFAPVPVHALSSLWQTCALWGLLLSTCTWIPCVWCNIFVPWGVRESFLHPLQTIHLSTFLGAVLFRAAALVYALTGSVVHTRVDPSCLCSLEGLRIVMHMCLCIHLCLRSFCLQGFVRHLCQCIRQGSVSPAFCCTLS